MSAPHKRSLRLSGLLVLSSLMATWAQGSTTPSLFSPPFESLKERWNLPLTEIFKVPSSSDLYCQGGGFGIHLPTYPTAGAGDIVTVFDFASERYATLEQRTPRDSGSNLMVWIDRRSAMMATIEAIGSRPQEPGNEGYLQSIQSLPEDKQALFMDRLRRALGELQILSVSATIEMHLQESLTQTRATLEWRSQTPGKRGLRMTVPMQCLAVPSEAIPQIRAIHSRSRNVLAKIQAWLKSAGKQIEVKCDEDSVENRFLLRSLKYNPFIKGLPEPESDLDVLTKRCQEREQKRKKKVTEDLFSQLPE